jgi:hypothetical protein
MATLKGGVFGLGSGRLAGAVMVHMADGRTILREHVIPRDPKTAKQLAWREIRSRAMRAYRCLTPDQVQKWARYADLVRLTEGGVWRAVDTFMALSTKFLHVDPNREIPLSPPDGLFGGDAVAVQIVGESGAVRFVSSGPNQNGVSTELLLAPMRTAGTTPNARAFRHQRFVAFSGAASEVVPARPGWWVGAVRFVRRDTGQMSALLRVGIVRVD